MNLAKSFSVYLASSVLEKAIGFLIIPILTAELLPESIGKLSLITSSYSFLFPFILLSTSGAIMVEFYKTDNPKIFSSYFSTALLMNFGLFIVTTIIAILFAKNISKVILCPIEWVLAIPLFCFFDSVKGNLLSLLQIMKKPFLYAGISLLYTILNFSLSLLLVYKFGFDYEGRLAGIFISGLVVTIFSYFIFLQKKLLVLNFPKIFFKDLVAYGAPLLPHALGILVLDISDRFFINKFAGQSQLGIYSVAYLFGSVIYILANAFSNAWVPILYNELKNNTKQSDLKIVRISYLYAASLLIFCLVFIFLIPMAYDIFIDPVYHEGLSYLYLIVIGYFFMSIYLVFAGIIFYEKRNKVFGYIAIINIIANITLNFFFIKYYQAYGAALATCISMFIFMLVVMYYSNKIKALPWREGFREFIGSIKQTLNDKLRKK